MAAHTATVAWTLKDGDDFASGKYSRAHEWRFDGGAVVPASPAPSVVPAPMSEPANVDPEEAFVASLSSCHMLFFLFFAQKAGFAVTSYVDDAVGTLGVMSGKKAMTKVELRPAISYAGKSPTADELKKLHHDAHEACFIANSVTTEVVIGQTETAS